MKIKNISLRNFRNYEMLQLSFENNILFFLGDNAQGKTNLLEAFYYSSTARSFRTSEEKEMVKFNKEFFRIDLNVLRNNKELNLRSVISDNGKYLEINENPVKKVSNFIGQINTVLFCPTDMKLLYSSPKERRKFIDMELGKISSDYMSNLLRYQKLLKERNAILKNNKIDDNHLDIITNQLIDVQIPLIIARDTFLKLLLENASRIYKELSLENCNLIHQYLSFIEIGNKELMYNQMQDKYLKSLNRDKELRVTQLGVHRDDFSLFLDDKEVMKYGSQGQRRSAILALKLGLLDVIYKKIKEYPILLLDDVLSELDKVHRECLFKVIPSEVQTFITTTDINDLEIKELSNTCFYQVIDGQINKED